MKEKEKQKDTGREVPKVRETEQKLQRHICMLCCHLKEQESKLKGVERFVWNSEGSSHGEHHGERLKWIAGNEQRTLDSLILRGQALAMAISIKW